MQTTAGPEEVLNQPPLRGDLDLWADDPVLADHATAAGADPALLSAYARRLGTAGMRQAGRDANRILPQLESFDRGGRRIDQVRYHPAYHQLLETGLNAGYAALPWEGTRGGHATHAAMVYLTSQVEPGVCCPMTMTYAGLPLIGSDPVLADRWRPRLLARAHDPAAAPVGAKRAATLGMAMTEKQGGSDIRTNGTRAEPAGDRYRLTGHKWFCSAPMSDGFLTLAQAPGGLSCFLVPRWFEDGPNAIHLMRLKDKLGNRANASAEIEYHGALAHLIGEEGAGVRTIIEMVHHTRLDTAMAPAGLMRAALSEAGYWCANRTVFQARLIDQPLMRVVLADLALDFEAATALAFRVAQAFDDPGQRAFARLAVALAKFLNNKRCPTVIYEAMETLGGMGYVEDTPLPMLYREAPLNSIWEGAGNVICLDILRSLAREPDAGVALDAELDQAVGAIADYDRALAAHRARWAGPPPEAEARFYAERAATLLSASVLIRRAPDPVAEAYVRTRVAGDRGRGAGSVGGLDTGALIARIVAAR